MNAQFEQATQAYREGHYEDALQLLSQLSYENPKNAQLRVWMGATYREVGLIEEARLEFQEALKLTDDPKIIHMARTALEKLAASTRLASTVKDKEQNVAAPEKVEVEKAPTPKSQPVEVGQSARGEANQKSLPFLSEPILSSTPAPSIQSAQPVPPKPVTPAQPESPQSEERSERSSYAQPIIQKIAVPLQSAPKAKENSKIQSNSLLLPRRWWRNLKIQTKLFLLLTTVATIPVIAVTQGLVTISENHSLENVKDSLQEKGTLFSEEYVLWTVEESKTDAGSIAQAVQSAGINFSNPGELAARGAYLQSLLPFKNDVDPEQLKSFKIITDAQGKTIAQNVQIFADDFSKYPSLATKNQSPKFRRLQLASGISLGDIPIVKDALGTGRSLSGIEILKGSSLKRLGLTEQSAIGIRKQPIKGLAEPKQPSPEGTYDVDGGKAGLVSMAVYPIKVNGKLVGTAIVGSVLNRNYGLVDKFTRKYPKVGVATVFAQDWRVTTNVPYVDPDTKAVDGTRAIGTRVSREVADKVLNQGQEFVGRANIVGLDYMTAYLPIYDHQKQLNPQAKPVGIAFVGQPLSEISASLKEQQVAGYGIGGTALLIASLLAIPFASSVSKPIRKLTRVAQDVAAGQLSARADDTLREDEFGILGREFNNMAANLELDIKELEKLSLVASKTSNAIILTNPEGLIEWANEGFTRITGYTLEEALGKKPGTLLQGPDTDPATVQRIRENLLAKQPFTEEILNYSKEGRPYWLFLSITPSLDQNGNVTQFIAIESDITERKEAEEAQRKAKELLQQQVSNLLIDIEGAAQGDLTVRANVTEGEMGTVADFFNVIIESLRGIVTQVKSTNTDFSTALGKDEGSLRQLAEDAQKQSEEITRTLDSVQKMTLSIQEVASSARQAAQVARIASVRAEVGEEAMGRTVRGILSLRETIGDTAKKVEQLGESSQQISKVATLINKIAIQTNLLAINAGVEAARAGEEGQGFAVVAKEVGALAARSASATKEIERIIENIRLEISEVIESMELSSTQAAEGTLLVEESKKSLGEILEVSRQIDELSQVISLATVSQAETSQSVNTLMQDITQVSNRTSNASRQVSNSLQQTVKAAQQLQESVGAFKVETEK
jgi:methyl-accepting chemotaxis protein PixJ